MSYIPKHKRVVSKTDGRKEKPQETLHKKDQQENLQYRHHHIQWDPVFVESFQLTNQNT